MRDSKLAARANRSWWDHDAARYVLSHREYLDGFHWCPEMLAEADARLLGEVAGKRVLEIGCGSAPCSSWLAERGAQAVGFDLSAGMLAQAGSTKALLVQADAQALPFGTGVFSAAFSAFGALPFVPDVTAVLIDVHRVLTPRSPFVFSVNHPMRWIFPDDPKVFSATISYFEREYVEYEQGAAHEASRTPTYVEYHRTMGDWLRALRHAGFEVEDLLEPEWPEWLTQRFGQWSPERGRIFPGTAIFVCRALPA